MCSRKSTESPWTRSIFVESDRVLSGHAPDVAIESPSTNEAEEFCGYACTAAAIADRLDLMGFTLDSARKEFSRLLAQEVEDKSTYRVFSANSQLLSLQSVSIARVSHFRGSVQPAPRNASSNRAKLFNGFVISNLSAGSPVLFSFQG